MSARNLAAEQAAGKALSSKPGTPFYGKNFADPNVKKSYFAAINEKVYGVKTGAAAQPTPSPLQPSVGNAPAGAESTFTPTTAKMPQASKYGLPEKETAYQNAKDAYARLASGTGDFQTTQKATIETALPGMQEFNQVQVDIGKQRDTLRSSMIEDMKARGVTNGDVIASAVDRAMALLDAEATTNSQLQQARGNTITDLMNKAMTTYGLNVDQAKTVASLAQNDYMDAFDRYSKQMAADRDLAFSTPVLLGGVAPKGLDPTLTETWNRASAAVIQDNKPKGNGTAPKTLLDQLKEDFANGMSYPEANRIYPEFKGTTIDDIYGQQGSLFPETPGTVNPPGGGGPNATITQAPAKNRWWMPDKLAGLMGWKK